MIALNLPSSLEKHFREVVRESYDDNLQVAIAALLQLHDKYGWKEQFRQDIDAVRGEVHRKGGLKAKTIDSAIQKYRHSLG
jgi:RNA-splicing ligase RtcB